MRDDASSCARSRWMSWSTEVTTRMRSCDARMGATCCVSIVASWPGCQGSNGQFALGLAMRELAEACRRDRGDPGFGEALTAR